MRENLMDINQNVFKIVELLHTAPKLRGDPQAKDSRADDSSAKKPKQPKVLEKFSDGFIKRLNKCIGKYHTQKLREKNMRDLGVPYTEASMEISSEPSRINNMPQHPSVVPDV